MKVIFSRKGMDNTYGGLPNPILVDENNEMLSLPIPRDGENLTYDNIYYKGKALNSIMEPLKENYKKAKITFPTCHMDPAINKNLRPDCTDWKPAFGQRGPCATHLDGKRKIKAGEKRKVDRGDYFFFFGRFQKAKKINGALTYIEEPFHAIYGYLKIGEILTDPVKIKKLYPWHPHSHYIYKPDENTKENRKNRNNRLYLPEGDEFGTFHYCDDLRLSIPGQNMRDWKLDPIFAKKMAQQ